MDSNKKIWALAIAVTYLLSVLIIIAFCGLIFLISSVLCLWMNSGTVLSIMLMGVFILFILLISTIVYEILSNCGVSLRIYNDLKFKVEQRKFRRQDTNEIK